MSEAPMLEFEVIRTEIRDSMRNYCKPGDMAMLTEADAQAYLDMGCIKPTLPDFGEADEPASDPDPVQERTGEQSENESSPAKNSRKGRRKPAADS